MSKVERKEYHETKVMRTMSPQRYGSSSQNINQFDDNLDHLLADLQSTVSRPSSSLKNGTSGSYIESKSLSTADSGYRSSSLSRNVESPPTKPITEYSTNDSYAYTAPDGTQHVRTVKKESYSYKTAGGVEVPPEKMRMQNNINQLDSLLDDLQQVKQPATIGHQSGYSGSTTQQQQQQQYQEFSKSKVVSGRSTVERDVVDNTSRSSSLDRTRRSGSARRELYQTNEGTYGRTTSPSPSRSSTLSKQTRVTNVQAYPLEVVETTTPDINPEILANLDPELLPSGSTKVTTTIKTYTYEIPGSADGVDSSKIVYTPVNQSITTPSKSFVYNTKYDSSNVSNTSYVRPKSPVVKEVVTTRNYQPNDDRHTYVYNETTTTKNYNDYQNGTPHRPRSPHPRNNVETTYIIKENRNVTNNNTMLRSDSPDHAHLPPVTTTIQRFDSMSNLNARQYPDTETFDPKNPPYPRTTPPGSPYDQRYQPKQQPEVNITYKYHSTSNTNYKNTYPHGQEPYDNEPLLPRKFPTDGEAPPKKLDELMANIGNEPPTNAYNSGWKQHEQDLVQQRKIDSLKAQHEFDQRQKDEQLQRKEVPKTKNVSGPPVYYPPGHEMFARKEESGGWKAEGAMAKEKGSYKYEAESKSKSKSSSGAAIVPVCLPLCCGLPCTII